MKLRYAVMGAAVNLLFFGALEIGLRLYGFQYSRLPRLMQQEAVADRIAWQNQHRILQHFIPDPKRMWRAMPGYGYVNADGFQGKRLSRERDPLQRRILFLGDSCTNAGPDEYPEKVVNLLAEQGFAAEPLIASVGGYSTYQGLEFFREAVAYRPDIVVAYFGWNDHWYAGAGVPDNEFAPPSHFALVTSNALSWSRTYQLMHYLIHPPQIPIAPQAFSEHVAKTRVPPKYFVDNLEEMIAMAKRGRVRIFFVVPPYGKGITNPSHDVLFPAQQIPNVHSLYRDLLRKVVERHSGTAGLVDVIPAEFDDSLMRADGIHPTEAGYARIADAVATAIAPALNPVRDGHSS